MSDSFKLPILVYHQIISDGASLADIPVGTRPYCLSKGKFIEQLDFLHTQDYRSVPVSDIFGIKENHAVGVTFDDGLESDYFVSFPELNKRGFHATFYIIAGYVGNSGHMDWKQIKELRRNGMEIGSHSMTHPCLLNLDRNILSQELTQSKLVLEDHLGEAIESFGVPYGFVNEEVVEAIIEAGYKTVCTSNVKFADTKTEKKIYGRYGIRRGDSMKTFRGIVEKQTYTLLKVYFKEEGKNYLKRFMGRQMWLAFREKCLSAKDFYI